MKTNTYESDKQLLEQWYLVEHLTMAEIGEKLGMSRQGVLYQMKKHCIDRRQGERFPVVCETCGKKYEVNRARWKASGHHYCSRPCFFEAQKKDKDTPPAGAEVSGKETDPLVAALTEGCPVDPPSLDMFKADCDQGSSDPGAEVRVNLDSPPAVYADSPTKLCVEGRCEEVASKVDGKCMECPPLERERARDLAVQIGMTEDSEGVKALRELFPKPAEASDVGPCDGCPDIENCSGNCPESREEA